MHKTKSIYQHVTSIQLKSLWLMFNPLIKRILDIKLQKKKMWIYLFIKNVWCFFILHQVWVDSQGYNISFFWHEGPCTSANRFKHWQLQSSPFWAQVKCSIWLERSNIRFDYISLVFLVSHVFFPVSQLIKFERKEKTIFCTKNSHL